MLDHDQCLTEQMFPRWEVWGVAAGRDKEGPHQKVLTWLFDKVD